jgi:hypothetical protein
LSADTGAQASKCAAAGVARIAIAVTISTACVGNGLEPNRKFERIRSRARSPLTDPSRGRDSRAELYGSNIQRYYNAF